MADVGPLPRRISDRVQRRVPRVFFRRIGGEEREVLPPHVARELRDVLLVADAQIHGVPTKPEVRMILRVVLLIQRFGLDVELDLRGLRRLAAPARPVSYHFYKLDRRAEDRFIFGGLRLAVRGVYREISTISARP